MTKLAINEVSKYIQCFSSKIINEGFSTRANSYNPRQFNVFQTHITISNRYGLNLPYKANLTWNLLPENLRSSPS